MGLSLRATREAFWALLIYSKTQLKVFPPQFFKIRTPGIMFKIERASTNRSTPIHESSAFQLYFTFIYCHFHFLLSFGTRTLIRFLSFSFRKLRKEILRCTFPLKKVIWRVIKSIHICNCQKQYLNSLFPPKLSKEAHKKMSFIGTNLEHWPFRRHCLHFTLRSNLGRNRLWLK